jgi:hypothetical protein
MNFFEDDFNLPKAYVALLVDTRKKELKKKTLD